MESLEWKTNHLATKLRYKFSSSCDFQTETSFFYINVLSNVIQTFVFIMY